MYLEDVVDFSVAPNWDTENHEWAVRITTWHAEARASAIVLPVRMIPRLIGALRGTEALTDEDRGLPDLANYLEQAARP